MSLTVRYPNGRTLTYNAANFLLRGIDSFSLYTKKPENGGTWVASFQNSAGVVVENGPPCRIGNDAKRKP